MSRCKPLKLPMDGHVKLIPIDGERFIYLTLTRPNVAYIVRVLSQFIHNPTSTYLQARKTVPRYLSGSKDRGILLTSQACAELN